MVRMRLAYVLKVHLIILGSIVQQLGGPIVVITSREREFTLTSYHFCIGTSVLKLEMTI